MQKGLKFILFFACMCFSGALWGGEPYYHNCEWPEYQNELTSLSCNLYFEGRGESRAGILSIAFVTTNRVESERFPNTIKEVVYQNRQFSWTKDGLSDKVYDYKAWINCMHIASYVLGISNMDYPYVDITDGSLFYHSKKVNPRWADPANVVVTIDNHIFYKEDKKL